MVERLEVHLDPCPELRARLASLGPDNPFLTSAYLAAKEALGFQVAILFLREGDESIAACPAFLRTGRLRRTLEIESIPTLPDGETYWRELIRLCHRLEVSDLVVGSFSSAVARIPALASERSRRTRCEYVLSLRDWDPDRSLTTSHRRNVRAAHKAGLELRRISDASGAEDHLRLIARSFERRRRRGESVSLVGGREIGALARAGAGAFFQATQQGRVLSSLLLLLAERGAYYHSAGTSDNGMRRGASHFLTHAVAQQLRRKSFSSFNLGGAVPPQDGLVRFKRGFGAHPVELEAATFALRPRWTIVRQQVGTWLRRFARSG